MNMQKRIEAHQEATAVAIDAIAQIQNNILDVKTQIAEEEINMQQQEDYVRAKTEVERQRQLEDYAPPLFEKLHGFEHELTIWNAKLDINRFNGYTLDRLLKLAELLPESLRYDMLLED